MFKHIITGCCLALLTTAAHAQTLFTYGNDSVSVPTFLAAFNKNNSGATTAKAMQDYLDLYITSRLKIKEAKARGYDTLPQIASDLENLRAQIIPTYLKDEESVARLVTEAAARAKKDIHTGHIFIAFNVDGITDTAAASKKAHEVLKKLSSGENFASLAKQYSNDPAAKTNGGDLGYITVFTLPYAAENIMYNTAPGKVALYRSRAGYHIFKNMGERPALGRMKAAQILLAFPPEADAATKASIKKLADSLYNRLLKGDDFGKLATQFSNDAISGAANGQMPEFGIGQFDAAFENTVYNLKDGAFSKPFVTPFGYHIVKRIARVPANATDARSLQTLRDKVDQSDRINATKEALAQKILKEAHYKPMAFSQKELLAYTDSVLDYKTSGYHYTINAQTPLFTLGDKTETTSSWITYAQSFRYKQDGSGLKPYSQVWDEFVNASAMEYYKSHLETYNPTFKQQVDEFRDGNLFFEIMQREVWNKAQTDSAALQQYYNQHKNKYTWKQSADAVIFYATDMASAKTLQAQLQKNPGQWKELVAAMNEKVAADANRFELSGIPNGAKQILKAGTITQPVLNKADNTASFAFVTRVYNGPAQKSYTEAKGLVINDYQAEVEKQWVSQLKNKYPVHINQKALATILR